MLILIWDVHTTYLDAKIGYEEHEWQFLYQSFTSGYD